ncbi:CPBP family intramembrane glutamic endopeptidase [Clostridium tepidiprofundi]|uniref:CPBP family intramembrane glutamic endopeptidase n=1 Tax=Clostridium tepidiprofundi TaxID=420412 RepID=UPI001FA81285|nr:type II CAAX endopeptidase family protein [Clostridium tepidiprofundi]
MEMVVVIFSSIVLFLLFKNINFVIIMVSIIYLLMELLISNHSLIDIGFNSKGAIQDVRKTWFLILLVGVILPLITFFLGKYKVVGFLDHVVSRIPMDINQKFMTIINIAIGTFIEEVIYRGVLQSILTSVIGTPSAIVVASIIFAAMHFSKGPILIVCFDMSFIFIDSIVYGSIFAKTGNLFASWTGHCLNDLIALFLIVLFIPTYKKIN